MTEICEETNSSNVVSLNVNIFNIVKIAFFSYLGYSSNINF